MTHTHTHTHTLALKDGGCLRFVSGRSVRDIIMASCLQRNHEWSASASYSSTGATTDRWRQRWQCWAMCLVPSLLAWCVYVNSLDGEFVHDDLSAITTNRDVIGASPSAWDFLRNDFWGTALVDPRSHKSYRPLTVLTFK